MTAHEQIKIDIATYFKDNNIEDVEKGIKNLSSLLTPAIMKKHCIADDDSEYIKAWVVIQVLQDSPMKYHSSRHFGTFIYNSNMYTLHFLNIRGADTIQYHIESGLPPEIPEGLISCKGMFHGCEFPENFVLGDKFDTSDVTDMQGMFLGCKFPDGFSLGNKFNTYKVLYMQSMFDLCKFPENFNLGNEFDTSSVIDMSSMFQSCKFPKGFKLGNKFDTSNVQSMQAMFEFCEFSDDFYIDDKFQINQNTNTNYMFDMSSLPRGIDGTLPPEEIIERLRVTRRFQNNQ